MTRKLAVVTGGSRGMGAAMVKRFTTEGWDVVFTYVTDEAAANAVIAEIAAAEDTAPERTATGRDTTGVGAARAVQLDLGDPDSIISFWQELDLDGRVPDAVVNNAAVTGPKTTLAELDLEVLQAVTAVNWTGTVLFTREAVRRMARSAGGAGGAIVNMSSTAVRLGSPDQWIHYAALKGAIDVLTVGLAREVGPEGIRVNAVSPGYTLTDPGREAEIMARFEAMRHEVPLDRIGENEEVAAGVYWLCSDESSYVTGTVLPIAGGR